MEDFTASKNTRIVRRARNNSGVPEEKWLRRRFQRDAATLKRMTDSLNVEDMTDAPFYRTFFPVNMEKTIAQMGVGPAKKKKMTLEARRAKKTKISKARARSRRTKVNEQTSYFVHDEHTTSVPQNTSQSPEVTKAWDDHIALLEHEAAERELMYAAVNALRAQQYSLALQRGIKRKRTEQV
mgnify:FL=1